MARAEELQQQRLSHQKQEKAAEADHYGRLRALGVDLSSYLMFRDLEGPGPQLLYQVAYC
eukprot:2465488-Amphidinium_carterae.1